MTFPAGTRGTRHGVAARFGPIRNGVEFIA
jgi:hypothetical protein